MLVLQNRLQLRPNVTPPTGQKTRIDGQWLFPLGGSDSHAQITAQLTPTMVGFVKRLAWNSLEPGATIGDYDFSEITSDLAYCASHSPPLYYIALLEDKSYAGGTNMLPAYLDTETWVNHLGATITGYEFPNAGGKATLRWKDRVIERYNALTTALAASFDANSGNNRYFLGIATQETAVGSSVAIATYDYSAAAYRDSYEQILKSAANNFAHSYVYWLFNFLSGNNSYMLTIAQYFSNPVNCPHQNVLAGGPDMKPWDGSLNGPGDCFTMYETMRLTYGIHMFCVFSDPEYDGRDIGTPPNPPRPHKTVNIYSTIAATTAMKVSATAVVGGKLQITVPCTNAQSVTGINPYIVGEFVELDDGTNQVDVVVQSISGSSGAYKATFTTNPAPPLGTWVGATASRFWNFDEYYAFARGTPTPDFPDHASMHLGSVWWYPTNSAIYDWDNGSSPGGNDGKSFVIANPTVWP